MIGRGSELQRLTDLVTGGNTTVPTVALVAGEAGVGKTRLVREVADRVPQGVPIVAGQAEPGALGRPFELLLDALDSLDVDSEVLAGVADRSAPLDERVRRGVEIVRGLAHTGRAVVVFEDLHWADSESITLFERLAEPDCGPLLLVGTYRPDAINRRHPVSSLLPSLERRHTVTHVRLDRLTPREVGNFLAAVYGSHPSFRVIESLHARTGGNPFFLEELLGAAGTELDPEALAEQPLPWSLAELVRSQLEELDPDERRVLEAAAVMGRRIHFDLLASVSDTSEGDLIVHLRSLVGRGLLVEQEEDVFTFRHALAREAVEDDLLGREKRRLNQRALDALDALAGTPTADLAAIAHHAAGAGDDARLADASRRGSIDYLAQGSTYQALELAELGLSVADDDPELLDVAARAAWLCGLLDEAAAHTRRRIEVARSTGDLEARSSAMRLQLRLDWEGGAKGAMDRTADSIAGLVEQLPDGREKGMALAALAQAAMLRDDTTASEDLADLALELAERLGDDVVRVHAEVEKGSALIMVPGRFDEGEALLLAVAERAEALGEHIVVARALHNLVRSDTRPRDAAAARRNLERMRDAAERVGFDSLAASAHAQGLADLAEWEGDLCGAMCALDDGRLADRGYLLTTRGTWFGVHEAGLLLERGDVARAARIADELAEASGKKKWYLGLAAHVVFRQGDRARGLELVEALCADVDAGQPDGQLGGLSASTVHTVVAAGLRTGASAEQLEPLRLRISVHSPGAAPGAPPDQAQAGPALVEGQFAEARGDLAAAVEHYRRASTAFDALYPYELGTAHVGAARCLIGLGRLDDAKAEVVEAESLLGGWEGWRVEELEAVRRRLGIGGAVAGPEALTPREREVVALLIEGLSNADLAARLYISPKTAAVHVSNVLAKLGMSSRNEVAAWARNEGSFASPDLG
jgi:DNA-binding CsgD family transcriptional regulator